MKLIHYTIFSFALLFSLPLQAQKAEEYTLDQLQSLATQNYPLLKQKQMYIDIV